MLELELVLQNDQRSFLTIFDGFQRLQIIYQIDQLLVGAGIQLVLDLFEAEHDVLDDQVDILVIDKASLVEAPRVLGMRSVKVTFAFRLDVQELDQVFVGQSVVAFVFCEKLEQLNGTFLVHPIVNETSQRLADAIGQLGLRRIGRLLLTVLSEFGVRQKPYVADVGHVRDRSVAKLVQRLVDLANRK